MTHPDRNTADVLLGVQEALIQREPIFHRPEHGTTRAAFEAMTEPDFWETGASGQRYSRGYVIDLVVARHATPHEDAWDADEFYCQALAQDLYLLTYTLRQGPRVTRRATIWRQVGTDWLIVYHQGTIVAAESCVPASG